MPSEDCAAGFISMAPAISQAALIYSATRMSFNAAERAYRYRDSAVRIFSTKYQGTVINTSDSDPDKMIRYLRNKSMDDTE